MSVINKKPFIKTLIESLSDADLAALRTMIDGGGSQTVLMRTTSNTFVNSERTRITNSDKGVHRCSLEVQGGLYTWNGYLIFNDTHCVLIYYTNNFQTLGWLKVHPDFQSIEYIGEELSIIELRSELDDLAEIDGTVVTANPTLAGTESSLSSIEIAGVKYKVATTEDISSAITGAINDTY